MADDWIDISVPIKDGLVHWPGDPEVKVTRMMDMARGDEANVTQIEMSAHTGTHMDAPLHFLKSGLSLDRMPVSAGIGPARLIQIDDPESIKPDELSHHKIAAGERILFKTRNSEHNWPDMPFLENFVHLSTEASRFLAECNVQTVGIDYLSVSGPHNAAQVHRTLLAAGIWIIEGLHLASVAPGSYDLICLPLKIKNSDGAPARAVIRPRKEA